MESFKTKLKTIGRWAWEAFKSCVPSLFVYFCAGTILIMVTMKGEEIVWKNSSLFWSIFWASISVAYNGVMMYLCGGNQYEALVSGNVKRNGGFTLPAKSEAKEYRAWKGFVIGCFLALFPLITGIFFGANQTVIDAGQASGTNLGMGVLTGFMLSGWSILIFYYANVTGMAAINYFLSCLFAILPIVVSGVFYILGAYGRRNKAIKEQELKYKQQQEKENTPKKVNYGGLPGTKPKKRK